MNKLNVKKCGSCGKVELLEEYREDVTERYQVKVKRKVLANDSLDDVHVISEERVMPINPVNNKITAKVGESKFFCFSCGAEIR